MKQALIVFTRIPIPYKTKTRLQTILSPFECANLHKMMLYDIADQLTVDNYDIYIFYSDEGDSNILTPIFPNFKKIPQNGTTLGEKMSNAMNMLFNQAYDRVALMGTDTPMILNQDIEQSFTLLDQNNIVLGLTKDGGYYLVAMDQLYLEFFNENIQWGTETVIQQSLAYLKRRSINIGYIQTHIDIDTKEDLQEIFHNIPSNTRTAQFLLQMKDRLC